MSRPVALAVAPNGARRTAADHPCLPIGPEAIAAETAACARAGAGMVHLHIRDEQGRHSLDPARYREAIEAIREQAGTGLLIQITTESAGRYHPEQQRACVRQLMPECASLALRELASEPADAHALGLLLDEMLEAGSIPQLILYHPDELTRYRQLQAKGTLPDAEFPLLFVLGSHRNEAPHASLQDFLAGPVGEACWMVCAFGANEFPSARAALQLGGHVRVGFENNLHHPEGRRLRDNAESVTLVSVAAHDLERHPADPTSCRSLLAPGTARQEMAS